MFNPLFTGELLRLSAPRVDDQAIFASWTNDDAYLRYLDDDPVRPLAESSFDYSKPPDNNSYYFHLRTLDNDVVIGFVVLFDLKWSNQTAVMAIGIGNPEYRGKGYGQDALKLILNYGFSELNLRRVGLTVMDYNSAAIRAYERAGFVREGAQRQAVQRNGSVHDLVLYGILRDEWLARS